MRNKKFSLSAVITLLILVVALAISITMMIAMRYFNQQVNAVTQKQALYAHITDIDNKVRTYYPTLDEEQLRSALAAGYVAGLQDPYARYYSTDAYKQALLLREGRAAGVGIHLKTDAQSRLVVDTLDADAAAAADVNGDGVADTGDAALILEYAAEKVAGF